ncbi:hypothetical protein MRX96_032190 [Rhipicephalus microplus]
MIIDQEGVARRDELFVSRPRCSRPPNAGLGRDVFPLDHGGAAAAGTKGGSPAALVPGPRRHLVTFVLGNLAGAAASPRAGVGAPSLHRRARCVSRAVFSVRLVARLGGMLTERLVVVRDTTDLSRFSGASPISRVQVRPLCEGRKLCRFDPASTQLLQAASVSESWMLQRVEAFDAIDKTRNAVCLPTRKHAMCLREFNMIADVHDLTLVTRCEPGALLTGKPGRSGNDAAAQELASGRVVTCGRRSSNCDDQDDTEFAMGCSRDEPLRDGPRVRKASDNGAPGRSRDWGGHSAAGPRGLISDRLFGRKRLLTLPFCGRCALFCLFACSSGCSDTVGTYWTHGRLKWEE